MVAAFATIGGLTGGVLLLFFGGARLTKTKAFQRIALGDTQDVKDGYSVNSFHADLLTKRGTAYTILRPSGKVMIIDYYPMQNVIGDTEMRRSLSSERPESASINAHQ